MSDYVRYARTPIGHSIVRMLQAEHSDPEVDKLARKLKRQQRAAVVPLIERTIARGKLPSTVDAKFVNELICGPLFSRLITWGDRPNNAFIVDVVETVLADARARAQRP